VSRSYYRDGDLYVVVETGMPEHNVLVGTGQTITEAIESLDTIVHAARARPSILNPKP
jgi:hypothetical protein